MGRKLDLPKGNIGLHRDNGKEDGSYRGFRDYIGYSRLGVYRDNGNYYSGFRV